MSVLNPVCNAYVSRKIRGMRKVRLVFISDLEKHGKLKILGLGFCFVLCFFVLFCFLFVLKCGLYISFYVLQHNKPLTFVFLITSSILAVPLASSLCMHPQLLAGREGQEAEMSLSLYSTSQQQLKQCVIDLILTLNPKHTAINSISAETGTYNKQQTILQESCACKHKANYVEKYKQHIWS